MPITQIRMIQVVNAALDYEQALNEARKWAQQYLEVAEQGRDSWENCFKTLYSFIDIRSLLIDPINSPKIIALEKQHFTRNKQRNIKAAARIRRHRPQSQAQIQAQALRKSPVHQSNFISVPEPLSTAPRQIEHDMRFVHQSSSPPVHQSIPPTDPESDEEYGMVPTGGLDMPLPARPPVRVPIPPQAPIAPIKFPIPSLDGYTPNQKALIDAQMAEAAGLLPDSPDSTDDLPDDEEDDLNLTEE